MDAVVHFGIKMTLRTRGYRLTRNNYAVVSKKSSFSRDKSYSDKWANEHLIDVMHNFDLNINYFNRLDHDRFNNEIKKFIKKTKFIEITDLNEYSCPGYYIMILDDYCQLYIGTSSDIKKRVRDHWTRNKPAFDRLIFGGVTRSKISINSFRALDTTRILVLPNYDIYNHEDRFIKHFSKEFICNRTCGGIMEFGLLSAIVNQKLRELEKRDSN